MQNLKRGKFFNTMFQFSILFKFKPNRVLITDVTLSEEKVIFIDNFCSNTLKKSYYSDVYSSLSKNLRS